MVRQVIAYIQGWWEKFSEVYNRVSPPWLKKGVSKIWQFLVFTWRPTWYNRSGFKSKSIGKKLLSLGYTGLYSLLIFLIALELNFLWLFGYMPSMHDVRHPKVPLITEVYTQDGVLMGTLSIERRVPVTFEEIDSNTVNALVATEDARFYKHHGLDVYALFSAAFSTVKGSKRGGSTITNQLVKNIYKTRHREAIGLMGRIPLIRTIIAKIKEWVTAVKIELVYSKQDILTMYFNAVEYGNNTFGLKNACNYYFSKQPHELKLEESAVLVGTLKGTSYYNPKKQPERSLSRRNVVLGQMVKYGYIDSSTYQKTIKKKLKLRLKQEEKEAGSYFMDAVKRELKDWCADNNYNLYTDGLKITTTLHSRMQQHAENAVTENMRYIQQAFNYGHGGYATWFDKQIREERKADNLKGGPFNGDSTNTERCATENRLIKLLRETSYYKSCRANGDSENEALRKMYLTHPTSIYRDGKVRPQRLSTVDSLKHMLQLLQCGLISVEAGTGAVRAWVGGLHYESFKFDHVDQAQRQAGSTFKPVVYARALMNGMEPCTTLVDEPVDYTVMEDGEKKIYTPQNSDRSFTYAPVKLRRALALSKNSIAVKLIQETGPEAVVKLAHQLGIESELGANLSLALGSDEVNLRELTQAYTVFVNGGKRIPLRLIASVSDYDGDLIESFEPESGEPVLTPELAYTMTFLLRGTVEEPGGTSRRLYSYGLPYRGEIGGKTGTSNDYVDGWYVGITPQLITGVWVGGDDRRIRFTNANGQGGRTALPIFGRYMQLVETDK